MTIIKKIEFIIDHIDPLGQGVFKEGDNIFFIPKTLPNESGSARVLKKKKGVHFAELETLTQESDKRITSECEHFQNCPGCHFFHCDYQTELEIKKQTYKKMFKPLLDVELEKLKLVSADKRHSYRNRIQLHYDKKKKKLGFINGKKNEIIEVPNCIICENEVKNALTNLYQNNSWLKLAPKKPIGHVEIYLSPSGLKIEWNKRYSAGGFTQVNKEMNIKLNQKVASILAEKPRGFTLDLFGGNGNLTNSLTTPRSIIDMYQELPGDNFYSINLHEENALSLFKEQSSNEFDTFVIDPPRSGFPHINSWINEFNPELIVYVSCHPQTMIRDLKSVLTDDSYYKIEDIYLLDLFPSTFHFEGLVILKKTR